MSGAVVEPSPKLARFASDPSGGVFELRTSMTPRELRQLSDIGDSIEKSLEGRRLVVVHEGVSEDETRRFAKLVKSDAESRVLAFFNDPRTAALAAAEGAYVWRVLGCEDTLFVGGRPPAGNPRIVALSKQAELVALEGRPEKVREARVTFRVRKDEAGETPSIEKQIVYGIVLEPETVDSQGDIYSAAEIEGACHRYLEDFQNVGHMHVALINQSASVVESYIAPIDFELGGATVKKGSWVVAMHVTNADLWAQIKAGELTGFSIGGWAQRIGIDGR
jgi:hypothetical protein